MTTRKFKFKNSDRHDPELTPLVRSLLGTLRGRHKINTNDYYFEYLEKKYLGKHFLRKKRKDA